MIIIVATFGQALSGSAPAVHIINVLVVWRFLVCPIKDSYNISSHITDRWELVSVEIILFLLLFLQSLPPRRFVDA